MQRLVTNGLWVALFVAFNSHAHSISIDGTVVFEDGKPLKSGTVILTEQIGAVGRMPDAHPLAVVVTDRNGKFHSELKDVRGSLDVGLVRDHCDWSWASKIISSDDLKKNDHIEVTLNAKHEVCEHDRP